MKNGPYLSPSAHFLSGVRNVMPVVFILLCFFTLWAWAENQPSPNAPESTNCANQLLSAGATPSPSPSTSPRIKPPTIKPTPGEVPTTKPTIKPTPGEVPTTKPTTKPTIKPTPGEVKPSSGSKELTAPERKAQEIIDRYCSEAKGLDINNSSQVKSLSLSVFKELGNNGLTIQNLIELKKKIKAQNPGAGESPLESGNKFWAETYGKIETTLMSGRVDIAREVWENSIREFLIADPKNRVGVIYGKMDIGSWAAKKGGSLRFESDIDTSSLGTRDDLNLELKRFIDNNIEKTGLTPKAIDVVHTAHGAAGNEVFIGEWGKVFAEMDLLKRGKATMIEITKDASGNLVIGYKEVPGEQLFWERTLRTGAPVEFPRVTMEKTEPMLSMEMLRHLIGDVENKDFSPFEKLKKIMKYVERSYFFNKKAAAGTGWDPYISNDPSLAESIRKISEYNTLPENEKYTKTAEEMVKLTGGELTSENMNSRMAQILERSRKAILMNSEQAFKIRLEIIASEPDLRARAAKMDEFTTQLDTELAAFGEDRVTPPEKLLKYSEMQKKLRSATGSAEFIKTAEEMKKYLLEDCKIPADIAEKAMAGEAARQLEKQCESLNWNKKQIWTFIEKMNAKHPLRKVYECFEEFNKKMSEESPHGKALMTSAFLADSAFQVFDAYITAEDKNKGYAAVAEVMSRLIAQGIDPRLIIPVGIYDTLKTGDPKCLTMAIVFYRFPWIGNYYMVFSLTRRADMAISDSAFSNAMDDLYKRTSFDKNGKISAFSFTVMPFKKDGDMPVEVNPPGDREAIAKIMEGKNEGTMANLSGFLYWYSILPDEGDTFSYKKKCENLRKCFPTSQEVKYYSTMLENAKGATQLTKEQSEVLRLMEERLRIAVWSAMADALEAGYKASNADARKKWDEDIAKLEEKLHFRSGALKKKIEWQKDQKYSWIKGENFYFTGLIYDLYIKTYEEIYKIRTKIRALWEPFNLDKARMEHFRFLMGGQEGDAPLLLGEPETDLERARQSLALHEKHTKKIYTDLADALGRPVNNEKDQIHLNKLGPLLFQATLLSEESVEKNGMKMRGLMAEYREYIASLSGIEIVATVVDNNNQSVIPGALIICTPRAGGAEIRGTTDSKGTLALILKPVTEYVVSISAENYRKSDTPFATSSKKAEQKEPEKMTLALTPEGIEVCVLALDGKSMLPLSGVTVQVEGTNRKAITEAGGLATLSAPFSKSVTIMLSREGYKPCTLSVKVEKKKAVSISGTLQPLMSATLTGPTEVTAADTSEYLAKFEGGVPPYRFQWYADGEKANIPEDRMSVIMKWENMKPGPHTFEVVITDSKGSSVRARKTAQLNVVKFDAEATGPTTAKVGGESVFVVKARGGTPPYRYEWYLNGVRQNVQDAALSATWAQPGTHTLNIRVFDKAGASKEIKDTITVTTVAVAAPQTPAGGDTSWDGVYIGHYKAGSTSDKGDVTLTIQNGIAQGRFNGPYCTSGNLSGTLSGKVIVKDNSAYIRCDCQGDVMHNAVTGKFEGVMVARLEIFSGNRKTTRDGKFEFKGKGNFWMYGKNGLYEGTWGGYTGERLPKK